MSTVLSRRVASVPRRSAVETWDTIVDLLQPESGARAELVAVTGIASSLIVRECFAEAPVVVYGSGPRVRVYCLYGEDALLADGVDESQLPSPAVGGNWQMSLPCPAEELGWVQDALAEHSIRITARDRAEKASVPEGDQPRGSAPLTINKQGFLRK